MIAGFALQDRPRRVIGIDGSAKPAETRAQVARIARHTAGLIGVERDLREDEIILDDRYHAGTYGIPDAATLDAIRLAGRLEGMITDPVYEGKSMAGLIDLVARREIRPPRTSSTRTSAGNPRSTATRRCSREVAAAEGAVGGARAVAGRGRRTRRGRCAADPARDARPARAGRGRAWRRGDAAALSPTWARSTVTCRTSRRAGSAPARLPRRRSPRGARA